MKIHVLSDLHLEFGPFAVPSVECDLVILAGDTHPKSGGIGWARDTFPGKPVLYVAGNHEFYRSQYPRQIDKLRVAAEGSAIRILENETYEQDGWRFFGATLWSDFALTGEVDQAFSAALGMNDFKLIRQWPSFRRFTPAMARTAHFRTLDALRVFLAVGDPEKSVVITHHAPSPRSLLDVQNPQPIDAAYASNLEPLIAEFQPALWIHGHIHRHQDYRLGQTRVLANPRGYLKHDATLSGFLPDLVVDL